MPPRKMPPRHLTRTPRPARLPTGPKAARKETRMPEKNAVHHDQIGAPGAGSQVVDTQIEQEKDAEKLPKGTPGQSADPKERAQVQRASVSPSPGPAAKDPKAKGRTGTPKLMMLSMPYAVDETGQAYRVEAGTMVEGDTTVACLRLYKVQVDVVEDA